MIETPSEKMERYIESAGALYYRLVLLVGTSGSGKTAVLQKLASHHNISATNLNLVLSAKLLELTPRQRSLQLPVLLDQIAEQAQSLVILDNLEILFDVDLKQDPLRLLQGLSRRKTVVASWNGSIDAGKLLYAEPGHSEYRSYESFDALVVSMAGTAVEEPDNNIREASKI